ncbi:MAG: Lipid A biosynthesis acyltransferase [candidate division TM6 bacterium GW2011_GWF2_28_16]|nr:MAG: Lipid A biosynthesis acyltransferase [candidate division TM6 bacterium GW2011_GWF2_28_16]
MIFATIRILTILKFRLIGLLVFIFSGKRKKIALKNINFCFEPKCLIDQKNNKKIIKKSFMLLGHSLADFILIRFYKKNYLDKIFTIKNLDYLKENLKLGKGVILSTGHFGSWELAAHYLALNGYKCMILYKPMKDSKFLEKIIKDNREIAGNILIPKENSLLALFKHLKRGGIVLLASDQHCYSNDGREVELFGHNVRSHTAFINLSLKTGAPILPGFVYTKNLFNYEMEICEPINPERFKNSLDPELEMAILSNKYLETAIKKAPENWLWSHRRFKGLINY